MYVNDYYKLVTYIFQSSTNNGTLNFDNLSGPAEKENIVYQKYRNGLVRLK